MSYKKYIRRGGKVFGPYIYHSRKVNGRVISEYLGKSEEKADKKRFPAFLLVMIVLLVLSLILIPIYTKNKIDFSKSFANLKNSLTGFSISGTPENETIGQPSITEQNEDINEISAINTTPAEIPEENQTTENATIPEENAISENTTETNITIETNITVPSETNQSKAAIENITVPEANITIPEEEVIIPETNIPIPETNITITNATIILTEENVTIETIQYQAVLNQPVKWKKQIVAQAEGNLTIKLPKEAENIVINKIENQNEKEISPLSITGGIINAKGGGFFFRLLAFLGLTGKAVDEQNGGDKKGIEVDLEIDNSEAEYEIEYETPAPYAIESETGRGKEITIVGLESVHYENVLSFTELNEVSKEKIRLYRTTDGLKEPTEITNYIDSNNNNLIDKIEWITPSLSNQTFEIIIEISKAEHLDKNKQFISDIYEQVKALDNIWSEEIKNNEYVRVSFHQNLTFKNDITIYQKITSGTPIVEIYEEEGTELITEFTNIVEGRNTVYLTNLQGSQDTFDLRVVGGSLELDYIVDPDTVCSDSGACNATFTANETWQVPAGVTRVNVTAVGGGGGGEQYTSGGSGGGGGGLGWKNNIVVVPGNLYNVSVGTGGLADGNVGTTCNATNGQISFFNSTVTVAGLGGESPTYAANGDRALGGSYVGDGGGRGGNSSGDAASASGGGGAGGYSGSGGNGGNSTAALNNGGNGQGGGGGGGAGGGASDAGGGGGGVGVGGGAGASGAGGTWSGQNGGGGGGGSGGDNGLDGDNPTGAGGAYGGGGGGSDLDASENGAGAPGVVFITYNLPQDNDYPQFNGYQTNNGTQYRNGKVVLNTTVTSTNGTVQLNFNNTIYGASNNAGFPTIWNVTILNYGNGTWTYNWTSWGNGTDKKRNFTVDFRYTILDDLTKPNITIIFPSNNTNTTNTEIDVNYTVSDVNLQACWYSNSSGKVNLTLTNCENITEVTWREGINNVTIWANDSYGNRNSSSVTFIVDTIKPNMTIIFPTNNTNTTNTQLNVNYTVSDNIAVGSCWYSNDSYTINTSLDNCGLNITITWAEGAHNIRVYANDSVGNENFTSVRFTVDITNPWINITYPSNNTNFSINTVDINYTVSDTNLAYCWYSNDTYSKNTSIACGTNITDIIWVEGKHNVTVWVNDSAGNENNSKVTFTVDTLLPNINITFPLNNTNTTNINIDVNYSVSDVSGVSTCWYSNTSGAVNYTLVGCANITGVTWINGVNNVTIWANDTAGNLNFSSVMFTVDTTNPQISITYPSNNTNTSNVNINANYTVSDINLAYCWYSNTSGAVNYSITGCANITGVTWINGVNNVTIWANDSAGNENSAYITFTVDATNPQISVLYPPNNTNTTNTNLNVNYTASDDIFLSNCWYSNDSYSKNSSLTNCVNITGVTWTEGKHNITIWANDSVGNENSSSVYFTIDTIQPNVIILYPSNNTNSSNANLGINYSVSDTGLEVGSCWYSNDSYSKNTSLSNCENITGVTWTEGKHNVTIYVNDSVGNENNSKIYFTIDTIQPNVIILYPSNNTNTSNVNLEINYSVFDIGLGVGSCWYSNDSYSKNTSLTNCANITGITWVEGKHNVTIYVNDSVGNENSSSVYFTIDTTKPAIAIIFPLNNTNTTNNQINVNYTVSDNIVVGSCWYSNDSYTKNSTLDNCGTNITEVTWVEGKHNVTVYVNDSVGNENSSSVYFTIDTTKPWINITFPLNNTNTSDVNIDINYTVSDSVFVSNCWYSNDSYSKNSSLTNCANITEVTWVEGKHNVTIWVNDTAGNENSSKIYFTIDTTPPVVYLKTPKNMTNTSSTGSTTFGWNITDYNGAWPKNATLTIWNSSGNILYNHTSSYSGVSPDYDSGSIYALSYDGSFIWNIYGCDFVDNCDWSEYGNFTITRDTIKPNISIIFPMNNTNTTNNQINVNYTISDNLFVSNCWYSNDSYSKNSSLTNCENITGVTWAEGIHDIRVYVNDSAGNQNYSSVRFIVDTINPNIEISYPSNNTNTTNNQIGVNYTASDNIFVQNCWYSNDSHSKNSSLTNCENITGVTWTEGKHNVTIYVNDSVGNENSSSVYFTIDTIAPYFINIANQTITSAQSLNYDINAQDDGVGLESFAINWTNTFSIVASTGVLTNTSGLNLGDYYINVSINDTLNNLNSTILKISVISADDDAPNITSLTETPDDGVIYSPRAIYQFNATILDISSISVILLDFNGVNYTANNVTPNVYNVTIQDLPAGTFNYRWFANDSYGNTNNTETGSYTINQNTTPCDIYFNATSPQTYGNKFLVLTNCSSSFSLYLNGTAISNGSEHGLAAAAGYNFTVIRNDRGNYSNNKEEASFTINKANLTGSLSSTKGWSYAYDNLETTISVTESNSGDYDVVYKIFRDNVDKGSEETANLPAGTYNYKLNSTGGQNYSEIASIDAQILSISKAVIQGSLTSSNGWTIDYAQGTTIGVSESNEGDGDLTYNVYRENISVGTGAINLSVGTYYHRLNSTGGANYSTNPSIDTKTLVINQISSSVNLTLGNKETNASIIEGNSIDLNCSTLIGDSQATLSLYSNGDLVNQGTSPIGSTVIFSIKGIYNITCTYEQTTNFTQNSETWWLEVNDTTNPQISITYPSNNTNTTDVNLDINYTASDANLDSCWYSNDSYSVNTSLTNCENITGIIWVEGTHNVRIYANDSSNNAASASVRFTVDTIKPNIIITYPSNNTNTTNKQINVNYTTSDSNLQSCWYSNDSYSKNSSLSNCENITTVTWAEGAHNVRIYANDSVGNTNYSSVRFTVDTINPNIEISYPSNNTNTTNNQINVNYTTSDSNLQSCWYSNDSYTKNTSLTSCENITGVTWAEGKHNVTVWANDSAGNENNSKIYFTIDTIQPNVIILYPSNNTNSSNANLGINYSVSDTGLEVGSCWYSNDSYSKNTSLSNCANITGVTWAEGTHNVKIYVNDTVGNENSSSVYFTIDTTNPQISIIFPLNNTNTTNNQINVNYTVSDNIVVGSCWYSNDSFTKNTSLANCGTNITDVTWIEGVHNVRVYANDTTGNENSASVRFIVDTIKPNIIITYPSNNTNTSNTNLNVNYTVSDANLAYCWYSNDSFSKNESLPNCGTNITTVTWVEGKHNVTVWTNDSVGNENSSSIYFTIDTIQPNVIILYPSNNTNTSNVNLEINYSVSDTGLGVGSCWYSNDSYTINTPLTNCGTNITGVTWVEGTHNVKIYTNDTVGNINYSSIRFTIDTIPPAFTNLANRTIQEGSSLSYDIDAEDSGVGLESFAINWTTTFSIVSSTGVLTNTSELSLGIYRINITVNDTLGNKNFGTFYINVTEIVDNDYPQFSNFISIPNNASPYISGQVYRFNATITTNNGTAGLEFNGTNYTATNISDSFSVEINNLGGGTYSYYWWAYGNGTLRNLNYTRTYYYTVNKSSNVAISKYLNGINNNITIQYPQHLNSTASSTQGTLKIYRNGADVTSQNGLNVSLPAGYYEHKFNVTGNSNYTDIEGELLYANITNATGLVYLYINETRNNFSSENLATTQNIWLNTTLISGTGNIELWVNGNLYNNGTSPRNNMTNLSSGFYNITSNYNGNENYTSDSEVFWVNITLNTPSLEILSPKNKTYHENTSLLLNYSTSSVIDIDSVWYNLDLGTNNTITYPVYFNTSIGNHSLYIYANNSNGVTTKNITFFINKTLFRIIYNEWKDSNKGNSTNFNQYSYEEIQNLSNIILENTDFGKIVFNENINITKDADFSDNQVDLDENVNVSSNRIEINSTALPNFNKSATLYLYNLSFTNPRILRDNATCSSPACIKESYTGGTLKFNVTNFTVYSAEETPTEEVVVVPPGGGTQQGDGKAECRKNSDCDKDKVCIRSKCVKLFDIKIIDFKSPSKLGGFFEFTYLIKSMTDINDDVQINFWIEKNGIKETSGSDVIYLEKSEEKTESTKIFLPTEMKSGVYEFYVELIHKEYEVKSYRTIEVSVEEGIAKISVVDTGKIGTYILISAIIIFVLISLIMLYIERKNRKGLLTEEKTFIQKHKTFILMTILLVVFGIIVYYSGLFALLVRLILEISLWFKTNTLVKLSIITSTILISIGVAILIISSKKNKWFNRSRKVKRVRYKKMKYKKRNGYIEILKPK